MQLTLDTSNNAYQIRSYEPGRITINEIIITTNFIIAPEKIITPWGPSHATELQLMHLQPVFALNPEIVLIGTGNHQQFLPVELLAEFYSKNTGVEAMNTQAACRTYNVLIAENRRVVAALFI